MIISECLKNAFESILAYLYSPVVNYCTILHDIEFKPHYIRNPRISKINKILFSCQEFVFVENLLVNLFSRSIVSSVWIVKPYNIAHNT